LATSAACGGDDDDRQGSPTSPTPTGRAAVIAIENFVATASAPSAAGVVTYTVSLTLRETAGVAATLSGITLTLTTTSGATLSRDHSATEAFGTNQIAANGTLPSMNVSFTGPPVMASSLSARITFTDDNGNTGTAQATTLVRSA
jgi:hypothetical protein